MSIVGVSPKNALIGGVAPTESPAATVMVRDGSRPWKRSNHGFRKAEPPIVKAGVAPGAARLSGMSVSGTSWPW